MNEETSQEGTADGTITPELLEKLKSRDKRFAHIDMAIALDTELRDSQALQILLAVIGMELDEARDALEIVDPTDFNKIRNLQARAYRARFTARTFEDVRRKGQRAADELEDEGSIDTRQLEDEPLEG